MINRKVFALAYLFDWIAGDPEWFPHPVRVIGKAAEAGERLLRRAGQTPAAEFAAGSVLTFGLVTAAYMGTASTIAWINRRSRALGFVTEMLFAWTCMASLSLHEESSAVVAALEVGNISLARQRLARIVGRDTMHLDKPEINRAVIETIAESSSDGVIAPMFYMAIGGVPLAMAYKVVNTLDSIIGHMDERYFYFGKVAARLDDAVNLLPSRLTAFCITSAAGIVGTGSPATALDIWFRDGMKHRSPNAGQPESAMAGALQIRLGGENFYDGESVITPFMGDKFSSPSTQNARQAIQIAAIVSILGAAATLLALRNGKKNECTSDNAAATAWRATTENRCAIWNSS